MHIPQIQHTATGNGLYTVYLDGVAQTPEHSTVREADEHSANLKLANPASTVTYTSNQLVTTTISYLADPVAEPPPAPAPAPVTPTVPTIRSASLNGNTLTLSGEAFGTKVPAPFKYDDFQNGALGAYLSTTGWEHYAGASSPGPVFSSVRSHTGTQCAEVTTLSTRDNFNTAGLKGLASDEIYYSVWVYHELLSGTYAEGGPVAKIIRINSTPDFYDGSTSSPSFWITNFPSNGWTIGGMVNNSGGFTDQQDVTSDQFIYGKWHRLEVYIKLSTPGGTDGACKVWLNNVQNYNHLTGTTRTASEAGKQLDNFLLPAMLDRGGQVIRYNMDGLYVDRTPSRVEVSTSPTWAGAIDRDVQVASSWSSTAITVTLRAEAFPAGSALYAYVIDANGNTNPAGFQIR